MNRIREKIRKAVLLLLHNPRWLFRILNARIRPTQVPYLKERINGVLFEFDFDYDPVIRAMHNGVYEIETIIAVTKLLKKGDTFIDVGANIGYLSAIAMGLVGKTGQVHSFEPVPDYFQRLEKMAIANRGHKVIVNQYALGERPGPARIAVTNLTNIGWNTMIPDFMSSETQKETIEVEVYRLDDYLKEKGLRDISLIKIDTEGFEFPVLKGLSGYFESTDNRPAIICEIAPDAYPLLGVSPAHLSEYMKRYGYRAFSLVNNNAEIDITTLEKTTDVVFRSTG